MNMHKLVQQIVLFIVVLVTSAICAAFVADIGHRLARGKLVVTPKNQVIYAPTRTPLLANIELHNTGYSSLQILRFSGICSCQIHLIGSSTIRPNEYRSVKVTIEPLPGIADVRKYLEIYVDDHTSNTPSVYEFTIDTRFGNKLVKTS